MLALREELRRRRGYVLQYVIFMRVTYILTNTAVNVLAPIVNVPLRHFALGTLIGCLPQQARSAGRGGLARSGTPA